METAPTTASARAAPPRSWRLLLHWPSRPRPSPPDRRRRCRHRRAEPGDGREARHRVAGDGRRRPDRRLRRRRRDRGPRGLPPRRRLGRLRRASRPPSATSAAVRTRARTSSLRPARRVISPLATEVLETGTDGGRGNWAALYDTSADRTFVYFHMIEPAEVEAGQQLAAGDRVGHVGCTGSCYGDHLHFEIRDGARPLRHRERSAARAAELEAAAEQLRSAAEHAPTRIGSARGQGLLRATRLHRRC